MKQKPKPVKQPEAQAAAPTPEPAPIGRPPIEIDEKMLEALAERALTQEECAAVLGISVDTLQRRYRHVYETGFTKAKASLRRKQFEMAIGGNVTMLVWLGKNLLGQADKTELTGKDGSPLVPGVDREEIIGKLLGSGPTPPTKSVQ